MQTIRHQVAGTVVQTTGSQFHVWTGEETIACVLRGRLKQEWQMVTSLVVAGDKVSISLPEDGLGVIEEIHPRKTKLSRPGFHGYEHIIAANVEQLCIVTSVHSPPFKRNIVDRFLVTARQEGLVPILVVNKCDLERESTIHEWLRPLAAVGIKRILTSAASGNGIDDLRAELSGKVTVLAGQSGVGKSSLINALFPGGEIRTQRVTAANKGRHTTSGSKMYFLPGGGFLVDTPGIKELALWEFQGDELSSVFPEIEVRAAACKFRDCSHSHEPNCAVRAAVANGEIDEKRYRNFLRLTKGREGQ